jgi:2-amino-4-hydroxy-6-hydroxymethyldihydropteridine diphosphokinase
VNHPHRVWLGLGANLGDPLASVLAVVDRLRGDARFSEVRASRPWRGPYLGPLGPQPDYINLCLAISTALGPAEVHAVMQGIEREAGRAEGTHELPRVLDIDVLLFDTLVLEGPQLVLPHPRMRQRRFVLEPLAELDPGLALPPDGVTVEALLRRPDVAGQLLEAVATEGGEGVPRSQR